VDETAGVAQLLGNFAYRAPLGAKTAYKSLRRARFKTS
jgi:hypothetical protein